MRVIRLDFSGVRCFEHGELAPAPGLNLVHGANGSGKSSLLEALHLMAYARSFRGRVRDGLVRAGAPALEVFVEWQEASGRLRRAGLRHSGQQWEGRLDGAPLAQLGDLCAALAVVTFEPGSHALVMGGVEGSDRELELEVGRSHIRIKRDDVTFTSKLIDGRFPDYEAVIPIGADREVKIDREVLRAALQRAAILSNEKYRGVRVEVSPGQLKISAHNPEQEEAQEEVEADTKVDNLAIGFNVNYLLDALTALREEFVVLQLRDANSSALVREAGSERCRHVVMPLRL